MSTETIDRVEGAEGQPQRRKACDLCFIKKIKCDMLKPVCSNCKLYDAQCRTSSIRRKTAREKQRAAKPLTAANGEEAAALKARLATIEKQLEAVLNSARSEPSGTVSPNSNSASRSAHAASTAASAGSEASFKDTDEARRRWDPLDPSLYDGSSSNLPLPSMDRVMPVVDGYFNTLNRVTPIFHQASFMRLVNSWYNQPAMRNKTSWAAILVVAALGLRTALSADFTQDEVLERSQWADFCIANAQSAMTDLVMREDDLLGMQVLVALTTLFLNSRDPRPAGVLIGTAMRLAHRLQLHSTVADHMFSEEEIQQRRRVFWVAYTLDKARISSRGHESISLRTKTPSIQTDADVDLPLPLMNPPDGLGLLWSLDGSNSLNHFRLSLDLAHIQGKIYDLLWSNRAIKIQGLERKQRVIRLQAMLDAWRARIPTPFRVEYVSATVGPLELAQMVKLHHAFLQAVISANGIYSHQSEWMRHVSSLSRVAVRDFTLAMVGHGRSDCTEHQYPPDARIWEYCVDLSRKCMKLFQEESATECVIWQCSCPHFSSLIILLSNMLIAPSHASISLDQQLTRKSIQLLDKLAASVQLEEFTNLQGIIRELNQGATKAVDDARLQLAREAEANNFINDPTLTNADNMAEDIGFPIFADLEGDEAIAAADMTWDEMFGQDLASHMIIDEVNFA